MATVTDPETTDRNPGQDRAGTGVPTWVKGFAVVGLVLLVAIVVMVLTGHGPGHHMQGLAHSPAPGRSVQADVAAGAWSA